MRFQFDEFHVMFYRQLIFQQHVLLVVCEIDTRQVHLIKNVPQTASGALLYKVLCPTIAHRVVLTHSLLCLFFQCLLGCAILQSNGCLKTDNHRRGVRSN